MNYFQKIKYKIWIFLLKRGGKILSNKESINWGRKINNSNKFLICMPSNEVEMNITNQLFENITLKQNQTIDIIFLEKFQKDINQYNYYNKKYIYPNVKDINHFPIKKTLISYIDNQYDVTIDLNIGINILSNYIAATKAKNVSVGFNNKFSQDFLTATVILKDKSEYGNGIKTICKLLKIIN